MSGLENSFEDCPLSEACYTWATDTLSFTTLADVVTARVDVDDPAQSRVLTGTEVLLNASGSESQAGAQLTFEWDLDGDGEFELSSGSSPNTTASFDSPGEKSVGVRATSPDANSSPSTASTTIEVFSRPPIGEIGVSINTAANYTTSKDVALDVVWPPFATAVRLSNDGGFLAGQTTSFELDEQIEWTLDDSVEGLYTKIVYARFSGWGVDETRTYSDDIIFDNRAPVVSGSNATVLGDSVIVTIGATDEESGLESVDLQLGGQVQSEPYSDAVAFNLSELERSALRTGVAATAVDLSALRIRVTDKAGNATPWLRIGETSTSLDAESEGSFNPITPDRILDTRSGIGAPVARVGALDGTARALTLQVTGNGDIPLTASAVALNVTVVNGQTNDFGGYVTVYPCDAPKPEASNLNFVSGQTVPNAVIAPLSATGTVCLYVYGTADLLADVSGYL